jgi:SAM-dependent methyltransferase
MRRVLNFGCGATFHADWVNLDASPASPQIITWDLRRGFPFEENVFDAVYGSHVLEHLKPEVAMQVLCDSFRILKPGGIIRIVIPDLETIARLYLQSLEGAIAGDVEAQMRYDWMILELYDQAVRTTTGGEMACYLRAGLDERQARFIARRVGEEALPKHHAVSPSGQRLPSLIRAIRRRIASACVFLLLGREGAAALREGLFRRGGEIHQWMYDRFSLARALAQAGFTEVSCHAADESAIEAFASYGLETLGGRPRKPDSLYVEGRKPA